MLVRRSEVATDADHACPAQQPYDGGMHQTAPGVFASRDAGAQMILRDGQEIAKEAKSAILRPVVS